MSFDLVKVPNDILSFVRGSWRQIRSCYRHQRLDSAGRVVNLWRVIATVYCVQSTAARGGPRQLRQFACRREALREARELVPRSATVEVLQYEGCPDLGAWSLRRRVAAYSQPTPSLSRSSRLL